ncbi:MAG: hypothetical protein ACK5JD_04065 [Mangrovibacterium sp.]
MTGNPVARLPANTGSWKPGRQAAGNYGRLETQSPGCRQIREAGNRGDRLPANTGGWKLGRQAAGKYGELETGATGSRFLR